MDETVVVGPAVAAGPIAQRRARRRAMWRVVGTALIAYGVVGLILLTVVGTALAKPIAQLDNISGSVEAQRLAALDALRSASATIDETATAVRGMDTSLADAKAATDRASTIALGISSSMNQLADSMSLTIFGIQPLIGLVPGFTESGSQLAFLAADLSTIGEALDSNREDAVAVGGSLDELSDSLDRLTTAVEAGPELEGIGSSVDAVRLGVLALVVWLGALAVGSVLAGFGCWWYARQP